MSKYLAWHDGIVEAARRRSPIGGYREIHHIQPRSLGGADVSSNLVSLTYREHFLIHWILTKIKSSGELRRMQRALFAMTLPIGDRLIQPWRIEVAKRAIRELEIDAEAEAIWLEKFREREAVNAYARKYRLRDRNGKRAVLRRANLAAAHDIANTSAKLSRAEIAKLARSMLYPGR